jgi:hypothetical protein
VREKPLLRGGQGSGKSPKNALTMRERSRILVCMKGTFQRFELTFGSFGQQYTTIDGRNYITFFDLMDPKLRGLEAGAKVEFDATEAPTMLCDDPLVTSCETADKHLAVAFRHKPKTLSKAQFIRAWCSLAYLYPGLHPDGYEHRDSGCRRPFQAFRGRGSR